MASALPAKLALEWGERWRDEFYRRTMDIPYLSSGILPSELLAFVACCLEQGVRHVVESGRKFGHSTRYLAQWPDYFDVTSLEQDPEREWDHAFDNMPHVHLVKGDATRTLPRLVNGMLYRTAVLLDGPKGVTAMRLADEFKSRIVLYGIHDLSVTNVGGAVNPHRKVANERDAFFTDQADWSKVFSSLDEKCWGHEMPHLCRNDLVNGAFCLGLFPSEQWRRVDAPAAADARRQ